MKLFVLLLLSALFSLTAYAKPPSVYEQQHYSCTDSDGSDMFTIILNGHESYIISTDGPRRCSIMPGESSKIIMTCAKERQGSKVDSSTIHIIELDKNTNNIRFALYIPSQNYIVASFSGTCKK